MCQNAALCGNGLARQNHRLLLESSCKQQSAGVQMMKFILNTTKYCTKGSTRIITKGDEYPQQLLNKKLLLVTEYQP